MPRRRATACAVVLLSPVSMTTRMPSWVSACSAAGVVDFTGSAMARMPETLPSTARKTAVAPSRRRRSASPSSAAVEIFSSARNLALPSASRRPSTVPTTPLPAGASNPNPEIRNGQPGCGWFARVIGPVSKSIFTFRFSRSSRTREPSSCSPRRPMSIASIWLGVAVRMAR